MSFERGDRRGLTGGFRCCEAQQDRQIWPRPRSHTCVILVHVNLRCPPPTVPWRLLPRCLTRNFIIISCRISRLIVIGEIAERTGERRQVLWQRGFNLFIVFGLHLGSLGHIFRLLRDRSITKAARKNTGSHVFSSL